MKNRMLPHQQAGKPSRSRRAPRSHGIPGIKAIKGLPPTPPQRTAGGGGRTTRADSVSRRAGQLPDTEAAHLLQSLNVRPRQVVELADVPHDLVRAAIADGQAR